MMDMIIVFLAASAISLVSALLHKFLVNQNELKQLKNEVKYQKERASKAKKEGNSGVESEANRELMGLSGKQMKMTMKPLMFTMIFVLVILGWMNASYTDILINLPISMPILSWDFPFVTLTTQYNWFFWYIAASIPTTFFFRKMLGLE